MPQQLASQVITGQNTPFNINLPGEGITVHLRGINCIWKSSAWLLYGFMGRICPILVSLNLFATSRESPPWWSSAADSSLLDKIPACCMLICNTTQVAHTINGGPNQ